MGGFGERVGEVPFERNAIEWMAVLVTSFLPKDQSSDLASYWCFWGGVGRFHDLHGPLMDPSLGL